jgi:hypothetical protein
MSFKKICTLLQEEKLASHSLISACDKKVSLASASYKAIPSVYQGENLAE